MCDIDWGALGTWAAVVVALAIAVEDKIFRRVRLRSERVALAALIRADLSLALFHLNELARETAADEHPHAHGIADSITFEDEQARADIVRRGELIDVPAIRAGADRLYVFDADVSKSLAEVVTAIRALKIGCEIMTAPVPEHAVFLGFMDALRATLGDARRKVSSALQRLAPN